MGSYFPFITCDPPEIFLDEAPVITIGESPFVPNGQSLCEDFIPAVQVSVESDLSELFSIGDVNCDGFTDVAYARPRDDVVEVYYGASDGLNPGVLLTEGNSGGNTHGFGTAVTAGDLTLDGCNDLVVGAPAQDLVYIYEGSVSGVGPDPSDVLSLDETQIYSPSGYGFGEALGIGDFDGDGQEDLVVGVEEYRTPMEPADWPSGVTEPTNAIALYTYFGSAAGLGDTPEVRIWTGIDGPTGAPNPCLNTTGARFSHLGELVVPGDMDGDSLDDIVFSCDDYSGVNADAVVLLTGAVAAALTTPQVLLDQDDLGGTLADETSLAPWGGDFNGDGFADVALTMRWCCGNADYGVVFYGGSTIGDGRWQLDGASSGESTYPTGFGVAGDINRDGYSDLFATYAAAGQGEYNFLATFEGGEAGLGDARDQFFDLERDNAAYGEPFWQTVGAGDVDGDGCDDLVEYEASDAILVLHRSCACD